MRLFSKFLNQNKLTRYLKNKRNDVVNQYFLRQKSIQQYESVAQLKNLDFVVFCIAFNKPDCIKIMIDCWKRNARHTTLVIIDNSSYADARNEIKELCSTNGFLYLSLPKNPEWHPNRSHALAMNWIFYNIVKKCNPKQFGYLDHDCFPFKSFSLGEKLKVTTFTAKSEYQRNIQNYGVCGPVTVSLITVTYKVTVKN